ncbi:MAG: hypothetical protein V4515_04385 [Chloroflexota bacterium]
MAIYRAERGRKVAIVAIAAFVAGLVLGAVGGRLTSPSLADGVDAVRLEIAPIRSSLDVIRLEYRKLLEGGADAGGAVAAANRVRQTFDAARPSLAILNPAATDALDARITSLSDAIGIRAPEPDVMAAVDATEAALDAALGR